MARSTMQTDKILTIAIPTFNRLDTLKLLLDSIFEQMNNNADLKEKIEIFVSDNNSDDGTANILKEFARLENINYNINKTNLGSSINVVKCFEYANTPYVWIIGDDDLPLFNSINLTVKTLEEKKPNLFYLPAKWINHSLDDQKYKIIHNKEIKSCRHIDLITSASSQITFISSWIVNKKAYQNISSLQNSKKYINTSLPHLEWITSLLNTGEKNIISQDKWIIARGGNSGGYNVIKVFSEEFISIIIEKIAKKEGKDYLIKNVLYQTIPSFLWSIRLNKLGNFNKESEFSKTKNILFQHETNILYKPYISTLLGRSNILALISRIFGKLYFSIIIWHFKKKIKIKQLINA